jgi:hypothetical protein
MPVLSSNVPIATGTLNALANAMGVTATTMMAIATMASVSFRFALALRAGAVMFSNPRREALSIRFCYDFQTLIRVKLL